MIDQNRLQELIDDFGAEDLADLIETFMEEALVTVEALSGHVSDAYSQERADQFHFLKGCALNVGANVLADRCEVFETRRSGFTDAEYQEIKSDFAAVQAFFDNGGLKNVA